MRGGRRRGPHVNTDSLAPYGREPADGPGSHPRHESAGSEQYRPAPCPRPITLPGIVYNRPGIVYNRAGPSRLRIFPRLESGSLRIGSRKVPNWAAHSKKGRLCPVWRGRSFFSSRPGIFGQRSRARACVLDIPLPTPDGLGLVAELQRTTRRETFRFSWRRRSTRNVRASRAVRRRMRSSRSTAAGCCKRCGILSAPGWSGTSSSSTTTRPLGISSVSSWTIFPASSAKRRREPRGDDERDRISRT